MHPHPRRPQPRGGSAAAAGQNAGGGVHEERNNSFELVDVTNWMSGEEAPAPGLDLSADYKYSKTMDIGFRIRNATNALYAKCHCNFS
jgi:hypothetical protein